MICASKLLYYTAWKWLLVITKKMIETKKKIVQAQQALEEAKKRRAEEKAKFDKRPVELKGRGGLEPTRFGDWEVKGIASDF